VLTLTASGTATPGTTYDWPETGFWEVQTVSRLCASFHVTGEERDETNRLTVGQLAGTDSRAVPSRQ